MKYKPNNLIKPEGPGTAIMHHVCGHNGRYWFGGLEFAQLHQVEYEAKSCLPCRNKEWLEAFAKGNEAKH